MLSKVFKKKSIEVKSVLSGNMFVVKKLKSFNISTVSIFRVLKKPIADLFFSYQLLLPLIMHIKIEKLKEKHMK